MSDLERLDEALADYENAVHKSEVVWDQKTIVIAARAYRDLLANGERVEWCEIHGASFVAEIGGCGAEQPPNCCIVPMLLYPTTEEER